MCLTSEFNPTATIVEPRGAILPRRPRDRIRNRRQWINLSVNRKLFPTRQLNYEKIIYMFVCNKYRIICVRCVVIDINPVGPREQHERTHPVSRGIDEPRESPGVYVFFELDVGQVEPFFFFHVVVHRFVRREELVASAFKLFGVSRPGKSES